MDTPTDSRDSAATPDPAATRSLLRGARSGDESDARAAFEALYADLRVRARRALAGERDDHTLQPTALVHEAWLRIEGLGNVDPADRRQFLALAAQAMRRILIDHARGLLRLKRRGKARRILLEDLEDQLAGAFDPDLVLAVDQSLAALRERAPRAARLVELRYFGGLSPQEAAEVLDVSASTAAREWRFARAFLAAELEDA